MLNHPTLDRLRELGLDGMAKAFEDLAANPESRALEHAEWLGLLVEREATLRTHADMPAAVRSLLPRLRDRSFTKALIVTLAEATPVHEAERLQQDLARAGIIPYAWVINQSLFASGTSDALLAQRGRHEIPFIQRVTSELAPRSVLIPWTARPSGIVELRPEETSSALKANAD